eukprot:CAMPEP_0196751356 /NCGR_PEP_ID=MMETSP1091-20130531/83500_1 /TAXON_ID=302021 /ORGANISM="Rhodomonas sp., Strain CCMP768" /LENGTH=121 /DNA_ID=CAMNT_0042099137 /DNA_START=54 /DNA_END=416 /DNA_ORIENTATION=+
MSYRSGTLNAEDRASWGGGELPDVFLGNYSAVPPIPCFALTTEDAHMLQRIQRRGDVLRMRVEMEAKMDGVALSRNLVAEIEGSEKPDEVVVMSGHYDSWDVGCGAQDDLAASVVMTKAIA